MNGKYFAIPIREGDVKINTSLTIRFSQGEYKTAGQSIKMGLALLFYASDTHSYQTISFFMYGSPQTRVPFQ
jgi:hypothetical protein